MSAKIVLTIGKRKLEFTPEEARDAHQQLLALFPEQPKVSWMENLQRRMDTANELELERLRRENRRDRTPYFNDMHPNHQPPPYYRFVGAIGSRS